MTLKTFQASKTDREVVFGIGGKVIHCVPMLPAGVILDFADGVEESGGGNAVKAINDLFAAAIVEEDLPTFKKIIRDPKLGIGVDIMTEIASWLAEEYTGRPTGGSSGTTSPETPSGPDSTDGHKPGATTYERQETPSGLLPSSSIS